MFSVDFKENSKNLLAVIKRLCFCDCFNRDSDTSDSDHRIRDGFYQLIVSSAVLSLLVHNGLFFTLSTILYPQLNITEYQDAWIASLLMIGAFLGALLMGPISDKIGRKRTTILAALLTAAAWAGLMSLPKNFDLVLIYIIRLISGFALSLGLGSIVYVSEITNKHWRPMFLGMASLFMAIGVPLSAIVGTMMPWRSYAFVIFVIALFNIIILIPVPESPHWLLLSQPERAMEVLRKLNKNEEDFNELWTDMEARQLAQELNSPKDIRLISREVRRPMLCLAMLFVFQQFGGVYIISTYALQILHTITQPTLPSLSATSTLNESLPITTPTKKPQVQLDDVDTLCFIAVGVIRLIMSGVTAILFRFIDGKNLLIWTSAGGAVCAFSFALAFSGVFGPVSDYIPLAFLLLFQMFETCGLQSVPWSQIGQLIPLSYRAKGSGIIISYACFLTFVIFMGFPYALELLGLSYVFVFFGIIATVACFYVYFCVPETRGKTFAEIEEYFG